MSCIAYIQVVATNVVVCVFVCIDVKNVQIKIKNVKNVKNVTKIKKTSVSSFVHICILSNLPCIFGE